MDCKKIIAFVEKEVLSNGRTNAPFRNRFNHTLRVMKWGERIQRVEGGDIEVVRLACLFHDIGWHPEIGHNYVSRDVTEKYLRGLGYDPLKTKKVLEAVEYHPLRTTEDPLHLESYIVMDADTLDEVGALGIIWDAMATSYEDEPSYLATYQKLLIIDEKLKKKVELLKTTAGKNFYLDRLAFRTRFLKELEYELF